MIELYVKKITHTHFVEFVKRDTMLMNLLNEIRKTPLKQRSYRNKHTDKLTIREARGSQ